MDTKDNKMENLQELIEGAFAEEMTAPLAENEENQETSDFRDPDHYREITGYRFRMTKAERSEGLTRQEAFERRQANGELRIS